MTTEWHAINFLLNLILNAPIPSGRTYESDEVTAFVSPELQENEFQERFGPDIEPDYAEHFTLMLDEISQWLNDINSGSDDLGDIFRCSIMEVVLKKNTNDLEIDWIVVRPCAEGYGFYKRLLWFLRTEVLKHKISYLKVENPLSTNRIILKTLGFVDDGKNLIISRDKLETLTEHDWRIRTTFPSADELNNPNH